MRDGTLQKGWKIETVRVRVTILTPVHIGTGERLVNHRDTVQVNNRTYLLRIEPLLKEMVEEGHIHNLDRDPTDTLQKYAKQKLCQSLSSSPSLPPWAIPVNTTLYGSDLFPHIRSTLTGKPLLPGSSIKGVLRTILMWELARQTKQTKNFPFRWRVKLSQTRKAFENQIQQAVAQALHLKSQNVRDVADELVGTFETALTRHMRIPDMEFDETQWWNSKVCGRPDINSPLQWKNAPKRGYSHRFDPGRFVQSIECLKPESSTEVEWGIEVPINREERTGQTPHPKEVRSAFEKNPHWQHGHPQNARNFFRNLFQWCNKWMGEYLQREQRFFGPTRKHTGPNQAWINLLTELTNKIEWINQNGRNDICILRVGWGSGFHAMSGDWQYADHLEPLNHTGKIRMKTRRVLFRDGKSSPQFSLPGFIQIELL